MQGQIPNFTHEEVATHLGKRGACSAATRGTKRIVVVDAGEKLVREVSLENAFLKRKLQTVLLALQGCTQHRSDEDPRRVLRGSVEEASRKFADVLEGLLGHGLTQLQQRELLYEVDTWRQLATILACREPSSLRDAVLQWVQLVSKRAVLDVLNHSEGLHEDERLFRVLGWLVAANLNLDAARLALAEGEIDLAQILMCRGSPKVTKRLMQNAQPHSSHPYRRTELAGLIYSFISGESEALLDAFSVDWRIRLGAALMRDADEAVVLSQVLEELCRKSSSVSLSDDLQFRILMLFAQVDEGAVVFSDQIAEILQVDASTTDMPDVCFKWLMYMVLSTCQVITPQNEPNDTVAQLFHTLCELCENLNLPEWSAFISLHQSLPLAGIRTGVERTIGQSIQNWIGDPSKEQFLSEILHLPSSWILHVKVQPSLPSTAETELELECLVSLERFSEAHQLLCAKMIPHKVQPVIPLSLQPIVDFLSEKQLTCNQHRIPHWDVGGGLILAIQNWLGRAQAYQFDKLQDAGEAMGELDEYMFAAKKLWLALADTEEQCRKIERLYDVLSCSMEQQYCQLYASIYGDNYIMTRVLVAKCKDRYESLC